MKKLFTGCLLLLLGCVCKSQHAVVVSGHHITYNKHEGWLRYLNGDTLTGTFQYADMEFPSFNLKLFDGTRKKVVKRILTKDIQEITLAGYDPEFNSRDSTYFKRMGKQKRLFRQLSYGETKIFDDLFSVDENPGRLGNEFIIMQDTTTIFITEQENVIKALLKLPKAVKVRKDQTILDVIRNTQ